MKDIFGKGFKVGKKNAKVPDNILSSLHTEQTMLKLRKIIRQEILNVNRNK